MIDVTTRAQRKLREILEDKIFLDTTEEVRITGDLPQSADGPELSLNDLTAGGE